jgi:hypothetical protein
MISSAPFTRIFFIVLSLVQVAPAIAVTPTHQIFLNSDKPGLAAAMIEPRIIDLEMARNEFEGFTIQFGERNRGQGAAVRLTWKKKSPQVDLKTYWVGSHTFEKSSERQNVSAGEVIDILVPNSVMALKQASLPPKNIPKKPTFYFEFHIGKDATPGRYEGDLEIKFGTTKVTRRLNLWIHSLVLPEQFDLEASFGFDPWQVVKKTYGKWVPNDLVLYREYHRLALEHRIDLHKVYVKYPETNAADPLTEGAVAEQSFMGQTTALFSGQGMPYGHQQKMTDLPVKEEYKQAPTEKVSEGEIENFWRKLNASVLKHQLKKKTFVYFIDEPKPDQLKEIGTRLKKIRKWAPDLNFLVTTHHHATIDEAFNIWCINLWLWNKPGQPDPEFYRKRQTEKGDQLWFYVGCNSHGCTGAENLNEPDLVIDRAASFQRAFPWVALRYHAEGILYYDTVYGYSHGDEASPWKDGFHFTGYGEGNLFYPCVVGLGGCKDPKIFPSLRLKIIRDGLEDVQIMKMARDRKLPVDEWVKEMIPDSRSFPKTTSAYERLKRKALRLLETHGKK